MTDAEKMREAAARIVDPYREIISDTPALLSLLYDADLLPEQIVTTRAAVCMATIVEAYQAGCRALPIPVDASAPAADCQQAGLVTAGEVEVCGICDIPGCYHIRERQAYVRQCTDQNPIKNLPRGLLAEVKAALVEIDNAPGPDHWVPQFQHLKDIARAALARLEREVG